MRRRGEEQVQADGPVVIRNEREGYFDMAKYHAQMAWVEGCMALGGLTSVGFGLTGIADGSDESLGVVGVVFGVAWTIFSGKLLVEELVLRGRALEQAESLSQQTDDIAAGAHFYKEEHTTS